jgi:pimeloyl-ACP methyl ester carboxylesterase
MTRGQATGLPGPPPGHCEPMTMLATNLAEQQPALDLPVYFFEGVYDYTCSYTEARAYFQKSKALRKGFHTFARSAHSPPFEEPARMRKLLREDVLAGTNSLADPESWP